MVKLKIGRYTYNISKDDIVLDNGACYQLITQKTKQHTYPVLSKKLAKELKDSGVIYEVPKKGLNIITYTNSCMIYYKFDTELMDKSGNFT